MVSEQGRVRAAEAVELPLNIDVIPRADAWWRIRHQVLSKDRDITIGRGKGFDRGARKAKGKIFAMISSEDPFVVKLSKDRVDALVASAAGKRFEPRPGKLMKEWLVVTGLRSDWVKPAKEARDFIKPSLARSRQKDVRRRTPRTSRA